MLNSGARQPTKVIGGVNAMLLSTSPRSLALIPHMRICRSASVCGFFFLFLFDGFGFRVSGFSPLPAPPKLPVTTRSRIDRGSYQSAPAFSRSAAYIGEEKISAARLLARSAALPPSPRTRLKMRILDGIPLCLASAESPAPKPSAPLLCLFFSAEWCPDCVSFLPSLVAAYKGFKPGQADVVFVSSDFTEEVQRKYMDKEQHPDWPAVTFEGDFRADLKRRYGVCAGSERSKLGIAPADRKGGVPTLVVFRASDGALLTMDGVSDVNQAGAGAVDRWEAAAAAAAAPAADAAAAAT